MGITAIACLRGAMPMSISIGIKTISVCEISAFGRFDLKLAMSCKVNLAEKLS
jgi:hypothetical protein